MATLTPSGWTMNMTFPASASIALGRIYTTSGNAINFTQACQEGHRRDAGGTPGRTSDPLAVHIVSRLPHKSGGDQGTPEGRRRDARAYIRPLGGAHCPTPATQKRRRPRDTGGTPEGRQGVHPTPWRRSASLGTGAHKNKNPKNKKKKHQTQTVCLNFVCLNNLHFRIYRNIFQ